MTMPKQIGNCMCCDATLWDDGIGINGGVKSYGGNEEFCGNCLQDQALDEAREEAKLWYGIASNLLAERELRALTRDCDPGTTQVFRRLEITTDPDEESL